MVRMANESIELYKPYTPKKLVFPVAAQQKLDGVPVKFKNIGGHIVPLSRQNEVYRSLGRFIEHVRPMLLEAGSSCTGELWIPGVPFKELSGIVRRHETAAPGLRCFVFDFDIVPGGKYPWATRHKHFTTALAAYLGAAGLGAGDCPVQLMPSIICHNELDVERARDVVYQANPNAEGLVLHSISKQYTPGTRAWLTQKLKPEPTIDLRIVRVVEATSTEEKMGRPKGTPLGMVGRLEAEFTGADGNTSIIGVGPGSLTHPQRRALWLERDYIRSVGRIAEVKYMRDDSYAALRQPTFVRWRPEKTDAQRHGETI